MRLMLTGRNIDVTLHLRQEVQRQLRKVERLLNDSAVSAQVVLSRERHRLLTDVTLHARGDKVLSGVGGGTSWPLSVKNAIEKIEQQAKRVKEKWVGRKRRGSGARLADAAPPARTAPPEAAPDVPRAVRSRYALRSMSLDEAAARFEGGTEPFVLYRDRVTTRTTLVFRRKDGQIGFLEPQG
jgi:putative sigma-54 modulation protein